MAVVTLNHTGPLGIPGGLVLHPGEKTEVKNWNVIQNHYVVKAWLDAGVLVVSDDEDVSGADNDADDLDHDDVNAEKDRLIADLAQFGIEKDRRSSVETLQEALDAALASENGSQGE